MIQTPMLNCVGVFFCSILKIIHFLFGIVIFILYLCRNKLNMSKITYQEWVQEIQWLRTKIILPNGKRIDKLTFMTDGQVDADKLNNVLKENYNNYKDTSYEGFRK